MGQDKVAQAQIDKIRSEQARILAEMYSKQFISMEELQRATGYNMAPTIPGKYQHAPSYPPPSPGPPKHTTDEEKVEIMSRLTKAWLQMPSDISFTDALWYITMPLGYNISDRDLVKLFEDHIEAAKKQSVSRQYEEAINKMMSTIEKDPAAAQELVKKFIELVK